MHKLLVIESQGNFEDKLYRVEKKTLLEIRPGPKFLIPPEARFRTNYPLKKGAKFERSIYHDLTQITDHQDLISSSFNWKFNVNLEISGTFHFVCHIPTANKIVKPILWQAYIIVNPELRVPLENIRCQTVLSKNLGLLSSWRQRLTMTNEAGYNMVHFTPIQELGSSNSAYSLRNQHKLNPSFEGNLNDVRKEVEYMEKKWNMLSITDIVLNHTADDSPWIHEHPECSFNMFNTPQLRPAFLLDSAFIWFMQDLLSGYLLKSDNLSPLIADESDVRRIGIQLRTFYVPQLKIFELFMVNITDALANFDQLKQDSSASTTVEIDYGLYERNQAKVKRIPYYVRNAEQLKRVLEEENIQRRNEIRRQLNYAIDNALNAIRHERLNPVGLYYGMPVCPRRPLVAPYFTHSPLAEFRIGREEELMYTEGQRFKAHNGWVMGACSAIGSDSSINSSVYFKRELIAWGDCIKLRYGQEPSDVPYLWDHMRRYVETQAKVFHGFRIDNCHSTPLNVAEFVVDVARSVRSDIYLMAELFTQSESSDNVYVNRLGLSSLIRESLNASQSRELGRLMYRFGGTPVGAFFQQGAEPLKPAVANAIFYDQTHDNRSPIEQRSVYDLPATMAILNMANCATGSSRGYDELVPHYIDVVNESRLYPETVDEKSGLLPLRRFLNENLQRELQGFSELFVDQVNDDILAITRHNPVDGRSIVLIARTAFNKNVENSQACLPLKPIIIEGRINKILIEAQAYGEPGKYARNDQFINGLENFGIKIFNTYCSPENCKLIKIIDKTEAGRRVELQLNEFQFLPSSVFALEIQLHDEQNLALRRLNSWQIQCEKLNHNLNDANYILFRCAEEDDSRPYELPNFCQFTYSGLYGLMYHLEKVRENQDQGHPLAVNLREGNWLAQYILNRLRRNPRTKALADDLEGPLTDVYLLPRGMVPKYFDLIISKLYNSLLELVYSRMSQTISTGPSFVKLLALSSVALIGECPSAPLPDIEPACRNALDYLPSIAAGLPHFSVGFMRNWGRDTFIALRGLLLVTGRFQEAKCIILSCARTMKHGLIPNLIDGGVNSRYNCRDAVWWWLYCIREYTRMAPQGNEILRCKVRRLHQPELKATQSLLSNGNSNGIQAVLLKKRSVTSMNGITTTNQINHSDNGHNTHTQYLFELIQEALECHFKGMDFVEERAGKELDEHMTERGFNIVYGTKQDTGFIFGGNRWNCGTWMDKMGSSVEAGTKGKPASPRDGSAIELVALSKAVISWLDEMSSMDVYPYDKVERVYDNTITLEWTWSKWASLIKANFEKYFYIPLEHEISGVTSHVYPELNPELINRRGIYKDTLGATVKWQDYQLRPNFLIACVVAPELFDAAHARTALELTKQTLCGPLGMKTLDPIDWNYCGDYDNANNTADPKLARGYNYHQGPEWLWLTGYYIRASSKFLGIAERPHHLQLLSNLYGALVDTPWLGLPELTNSNGSFCKDSCRTQAWSLGTTLEALYESVRTTR